MQTPHARLTRTRRAYIALSWLPVAAIIYARWSLSQMEGFAASAAGGYVVLPALLLSAVLFGIGALLLALRRHYDAPLIAAALLAGSPIAYFLLGAWLR